MNQILSLQTCLGGGDLPSRNVPRLGTPSQKYNTDHKVLIQRALERDRCPGHFQEINTRSDHEGRYDHGPQHGD